MRTEDYYTVRITRKCDGVIETSKVNGWTLNLILSGLRREDYSFKNRVEILCDTELDRHESETMTLAEKFLADWKSTMTREELDQILPETE